MARKNNNQALPAVEATILVTGITKQVVKCTARKAFRLNNVVVQEGETFFLVKSTKRENRYYVVHFCSERNTYQCSCGANCSEHAHLKVVREHVMSTVVAPKSTPMTVPATAAEIKATRKAKDVQTSEQFDGSRQITAEEWKAIAKADRKRQKAWADEYRQAAAALAAS